MTELLIDGMPVVLPAGFEETITMENPFLTKDGEYSFDITISLKCAQNRRIYRHINRLNSTESIGSRKAILISDNQVFINGVENILEVSDTEAKIQLLSGNSELNFIGSTKKLSDLDLGTVSEFTYASGRFPQGSGQTAIYYPYLDNQSDTSFYPEFNYCRPTIKTTDGKLYNLRVAIYNPNTNSDYQILPHTKGIPQPYLLYYIDRIITVTGFTIKENYLSGIDMLKRLYIVNTINSNYYNDFLPDWTVSEFISQAEKFFNVVFVINRISKSVRILKSATHFANKKVFINSVSDTIPVEHDADNNINAISYDYVGYDLHGDDKYMKIDDDILAKVSYNELANYDALKSEVAAHLAKYMDQKQILHVAYSDNHYIIQGKLDGYDIRPVNIFGNIGDKSGNQVSLKIVPAAMDSTDAVLWDNVVRPNITTVGKYQVAVSADYSEESAQGLTDMIEDGLSTLSKPDVIRVAIFSGADSAVTTSGDIVTNHNQAPFLWSQNDTFLSFVWPGKIEKRYYPKRYYDALTYINTHTPTDMFYSLNQQIYNSTKALFDSFTLRLSGSNGMYKRFYEGSLNIDVTKKTQFTWHDSIAPDVRSEFIIRNRRYICEKIEISITATGIKKELTGYFYPIIEDNAAITRGTLLENGAYIDKYKYTDDLHWNDASTLPVTAPAPEEDETNYTPPDRTWILDDAKYNDSDAYTDAGHWNDTPTV